MELLSQSDAQDVIAHAMGKGADFIDLFIERTNTQNIQFKSSKVEASQGGVNFGIGIRLIFGTNSVYGFTNSKDKNELCRIIDVLCANKSQAAKNWNQNFEKQTSAPEIAAYASPSIDVKNKIATLASFDQLVRKHSPLISQVSVGLLQIEQQVEIYNSEGLMAKDFRPYTRFMSSAYAKDGSEEASSYMGPGARGGWDFVNTIDLKEMSEELVRKTLTILKAKPCPAGQLPVVIDSGFGGVIFHEACGHLLETTSVQKKASVFWDKMGEKIAHSALSAVDDGTIDRMWGSISLDDEGMETQKTQLIKDGILTQFISDKMGELKTGHKRTGSGRRQSYKYHPASRMRNTYIEPGKFTKEELIESMSDGIYAKSMGGGSVNPGTGEFNFSVEEGYIVKNGKIQEAVKGRP